MSEKDEYRILVELTGVDKEVVRLNATEYSVDIKTDDGRKLYNFIESG